LPPGIRRGAYFFLKPVNWAMRVDVTPDQIEQYQRDGFIVLHGFLDEVELHDWRTQVDEAVEQRLASGGDLQNQDDPDAYYAQVFTQCLKLADTHAGVRRLMLDPRLGKLAAQLAGVDGIRIWHDQALIKPPFGNPTAWHLDNPYWSFSSPDALSIWVALDDATESNGCLYYIPGSHHSARYENATIGTNIAALFATYPEWRAIEPIAAPCKAGSAVLHNGLCAHGAGANMTNRPRRAMTCAYMPDGSTFNGIRNILPEDYFSSLTLGQVLDDDVVNPLVWRNES
jgi:ectoine hydroxylase-related dioxygenase (phytanoyl-CoA dioxygenase family)